MGNQQKPMESKCQLVIYLDNKVVECGQQVRGSLYYNFEEPYPSNIITVTFEGNQDFRCHSGEYGILNHFKQIIQLKHIFNSSNDSCFIGEGFYQFAFTLPLHLPPSFYFFGNHSSKIFTNYSVTAGISDMTGNQKFQRQSIVTKRVVQVNASAPGKMINIKAQANYDINPMFNSHGNGSITQNFHLDKNFYGPHEDILLQGELYNFSSKEIKDIEVSFVRVVKAYNSKGDKYIDSTVLFSQTTQSIRADSVDHVEQIIPLSQLQIYPRKKFNERGLEKFKSDQRNFSAEIGIYQDLLQPTHKDFLLECRYYVEIKTVMKVFFPIDKIKPIIIDIIINSKMPDQQLPLIQIPNDTLVTHRQIQEDNLLIEQQPQNQQRDYHNLSSQSQGRMEQCEQIAVDLLHNPFSNHHNEEEKGHQENDKSQNFLQRLTNLHKRNNSFLKLYQLDQQNHKSSQQNSRQRRFEQIEVSSQAMQQYSTNSAQIKREGHMPLNRNDDDQYNEAQYYSEINPQDDIK